MKHIVIERQGDCCGCSACSAVCPKQCITMKPDELGFMYPSVDTDLCIECGLCVRTCPFINEAPATEPQECFAAANNDAAELELSSSGGVFIALARQTIEAGGVVFGAEFDTDWSVHHRSADTLDCVRPMMESKYLQSRMENCYREARTALTDGRRVLFTGTPCQIAGLRHSLRRDYDNLLTVEVICHGAPSPAVWQNYLSETLARPQGGRAGKNTVLPTSPTSDQEPAIAVIRFRDKRLGWKKFGFVLLPLTSASGGEQNSVLSSSTDIFEPHGANRYMQAFLRNWSLRPSCFSCRAKSGHSGADITIGDFWGIHRLEGFTDDDRGTSCVVCRTDRGRRAIGELAGITLTPAPYSVILAGNPSMEHSVSETAEARKFRSLFPTRGLADTMRRVEHVPLWRLAARSLRYRLRTLISSAK